MRPDAADGNLLPHLQNIREDRTLHCRLQQRASCTQDPERTASAEPLDPLTVSSDAGGEPPFAGTVASEPKTIKSTVLEHGDVPGPCLCNHNDCRNDDNASVLSSLE